VNSPDQGGIAIEEGALNDERVGPSYCLRADRSRRFGSGDAAIIVGYATQDRRTRMRKPNYRFDRAERDRAKRAKKDEKLKSRQERAASRQPEASPPVPDDKESSPE